MTATLALELKLLANQIQGRELEEIYIHTLYSVRLACNNELKGMCEIHCCEVHYKVFT